MDVSNQFMVGALGDKVVITLPPTRPLSKEEALTLAAWLVAIVTGDPEHVFQPILSAVLST